MNQMGKEDWKDSQNDGRMTMTHVLISLNFN
jgi:hypothetical protein